MPKVFGIHVEYAKSIVMYMENIAVLGLFLLQEVITKNAKSSLTYMESMPEVFRLFGYRYNQLPRLIEQTPQWLSGPSPRFCPSPPDRPPITRPDPNYVLTRCNFYSTIGMG
jgi:hypothetical protein